MANAPARQAGRCGFESRWDREGETPVRIWLTLTSVSGAQVAGDAASDINAGTSDSSAERTPLSSSPAVGQHPDAGDPESQWRE
jgi:hypothetical protein